ncbi:MAG: GGDEF domain-containing protein [Fibromonadaceae bacterium]|jgi:diguanylate cyclase (GGDEF)-like protein|nr:GGDEF domain-containing protein [Fibromonadaceae bacterium]
MKDVLKKIGTWLFLGAASNKSFNIDKMLEVIIVNMIAMFGVFCFCSAFFLTSIFSQETYPAMTYIMAFVLAIVFTATHTNKGIEYFKVVKFIVLLSAMLFYGFVYAKATYGYVWSFLVPIMIIFLTNIYIGLILCFCYFFLMMAMEHLLGINEYELFFRQIFVYWFLVVMVGVYEALRMWYNKRMQEDKEKIEILSLTDHLTKLYNRRYFSDMIEKEFARAIRQKECLSFLMIDADKFKDYNDTYGHLHGDELLVSLAEIFKRIVKRSEDLIFRMGGEEFGVLLPNTEFKGAFSIAEKIREEVQNSTKITISIGLASIFPKVGEISETLMKLADSNLYKAKETGRNKVVG